MRIGAKEQWLNLLFFLFIALILYNRVLLFLNININFIDSDQPFMWAGALDYSKGIFMEPRFYGQNYNTFMEPFFSVPFIWCGVPVYYALPIATHFIFLFPFLFTACALFFNEKKYHALVVLALLMCLPSSYDILTSLPRGFVTGVFFSSFFVLSLLQPNRLSFIALNFFMMVLGYFVSPNALLTGLPFIFYLFLQNHANWRFYMIGVIMLLFCLPFYFLFDYFYKQHPDYVIYSFKHDFSLTYLLDNLFHPNQAFAHLGFFMEENAIVLALSVCVLAYFLFLQNKKAFYAFLAFLVLLLMALSSGKSRDGSFWPWYSYSRMYIGIPLLMALLLVTLPLRRNLFLVVLFISALSFSTYKILRFQKNVQMHTQENLWIGVHLVSLKSATEAMSFYRQTCVKENVPFFLISNGFWLNTFLDYGGAAVYKDFPETEESNSERRYWVREGNKNRIIPRFAFLSSSYNFDKLVHSNASFELQKLDDYGLMLVKNNRLTMGEFIKLSREAEARE